MDGGKEEEEGEKKQSVGVEVGRDAASSVVAEMTPATSGTVQAVEMRAVMPKEEEAVMHGANKAPAKFEFHPANVLQKASVTTTSSAAHLKPATAMPTTTQRADQSSQPMSKQQKPPVPPIAQQSVQKSNTVMPPVSNQPPINNAIQTANQGVYRLPTSATEAAGPLSFAKTGDQSLQASIASPPASKPNKNAMLTAAQRTILTGSMPTSKATAVPTVAHMGTAKSGMPLSSASNKSQIRPQGPSNLSLQYSHPPKFQSQSQPQRPLQSQPQRPLQSQTQNQHQYQSNIQSRPQKVQRRSTQQSTPNAPSTTNSSQPLAANSQQIRPSPKVSNGIGNSTTNAMRLEQMFGKDAITSGAARKRQLALYDLALVTNPDMETPFIDREDAMRRLLPYHVSIATRAMKI